MKSDQEARLQNMNKMLMDGLSKLHRYDPNLIAVVMKLVEPKEQNRIDALGALYFLEEIEHLEDFEFSE